jgi:hypothetical protein
MDQAAELSADLRISVIPVRVSAKKKSLPRIKNSEKFFHQSFFVKQVCSG